MAFRLQMKHWKLAVLWLGLIFLLTGCGGYTDASVRIPSGWGEYTAAPLTFKFEAGWHEEDADAMAQSINSGTGLFGLKTTAQVMKVLASPTREQGTVDYLTVSCYTTGQDVTAEDLEAAMDDLNGMSRTIKNQAGLYADVEQNARIRHYGDVDALTIAYRLSNDETTCMIQLALIPYEQYIFQIAFCDFTQQEDNDYLEAILTSLIINEEKES